MAATGEPDVSLTLFDSQKKKTRQPKRLVGSRRENLRDESGTINKHRLSIEYKHAEKMFIISLSHASAVFSSAAVLARATRKVCTEISRAIGVRLLLCVSFSFAQFSISTRLESDKRKEMRYEIMGHAGDW